MIEEQRVRLVPDAVAEGCVLWHHHALERLLDRETTRTEVLVRSWPVKSSSDIQPTGRCRAI
jgi:hypothetical protein